MKKKYLISLLLISFLSCKITEKKLVGYYNASSNADQQYLKLNSDHTFLYQDYNFLRLLVKKENIDSCLFETEGTWLIKEKKIFLNSFSHTFSDTNRIANISKEKTNSEVSNFSFHDIFGRSIIFNAIADEKSTFAFIFHKAYLDYDIDLKKHKTLTFFLEPYKPLAYVVQDTVAANYKITVVPYYKDTFFKKKSFTVRKNRIQDTLVKFKKLNEIKDFTSPNFVHGSWPK